MGTISDVPGLIEGVKARGWRRTLTHGFVEASEVDHIEQLTPQGRGSSEQKVKETLKMHAGKVGLDNLDSLCRRASPSLALSRKELSAIFEVAPKDAQGLVDWHEFVDYIYAGSRCCRVKTTWCRWLSRF